MECAVILGKRGMRRVHLVDADEEMGGIMRWIPSLPGLGEWGRVVNWRAVQISKLRNIELILHARLQADEIREYGAEIVVLATGSRWAGDGLNPVTRQAIPGADSNEPWCLTPEQIMLEAKQPTGQRVVVYDTEGYFVGVSLADRLAREGKQVTFVTPFVQASPYTFHTGEGARLNRMFHAVGVELVLSHFISRLEPGRRRPQPRLRSGRREGTRNRQRCAGHAAAVERRLVPGAERRSRCLSGNGGGAAAADR